MKTSEPKYYTVAEKAKRYDEALEELRGLLEGIREEKREILEEDITSIFPELQENEDERIRKSLIDMLKNDEKCYLKEIAWLEKQGEQKFAEGTFVNVDDVREDFVQEVYRVLDADPTNDRANQIIDAFDSLPTVTIEKQGENHDDKYNITGIKSKHAEGKLGEMLKKIKSTDKVEPKFHEGQWIIWQDKCYKVNYNGCGYELIDQNGLSTSLEYGTIDENAHLFSIKDAKAGDVLVCKGNIKGSNGIKYERICLFNNLDNAFFTLTKVSNCVEEYDINVNIDYPDNTVPATKEQKEILFMVMKGTGYEWDVEKKELKKIEDEIEIPFGAKDSELIEESYYIPKVFHAEIDEDKVVIKKGEKPTAWSEEDENIKEWIMSDINKLLALNRKSFVIADKEITWLKSLKGRVGCEVNCTTTKKWSEEDIATISRVISIVKWAAYSDHSHPILNDEGATELVERLKSLKERYTWKPSDEQMDALQYVCRNLNPPLSDKLGWDSLKTLELLYKILKKLY